MRRSRHIVAGVMRVLGLLIVVSVASLVLATSGGSRARRASVPVTLATVPGGVFAVAQSGGRVVWGGCRGPVVWTGLGVVQLGATKGSECWGGAWWLALAGKRVLWADISGGNTLEVHVFTASFDNPRRDRVSSYFESGSGDGVEFGGITSSGSALVYSTVPVTTGVGVSPSLGDCLDTRLVCRWRYGRGQTTLVAASGRASKRVGGGFAIAASDRFYALAKHGGMTTRVGAVVTSCRCSYTPDWSPDGKSIALTGGWASAGTSIFIESVDGSSLQRVTSGNNVLDSNPRWSPDGSRLAFDRDGSSVYVVSPGGVPKRLTNGRQPDWSPDGSRIVFARSSGIYTMDPSGGSVKRVAVGVDVGEYVEFPRWSPDASRIAFLRNGRIYIVPAAGGKATLASTDASVRGADWSPSGDRLALWNETGVSVLDVATGVSKLIAEGMFPSWSRDGRLAYSETYGSAIRIVDSSGKRLGRLVPPNPTVPDVSIEVRRVRNSSLVRSFVPRGDVLSLGLSNRYMAFLANERDKKSNLIQIYSLPSGRLLRNITITAPAWSGRAWPRLAVSGSRVIFTDGRAIRLLDVRTGNRTRLALTKVAPSDLSISGNRVVWIENRGPDNTRGMVQSVVIPQTKKSSK